MATEQHIADQTTFDKYEEGKQARSNTLQEGQLTKNENCVNA